MAYERIVAAAMKREGGSLWEIADEIVKSTGPSRDGPGKNTGLYKEIKAIAEELEKNGLEKYDEESLSRMRITAITFKENDRIPEIGFHTHRIAGTPERLKNVIEYAVSVGRTKAVSQAFIKEYEGLEKEYRREARKEALTAKEEAAAKIAEAKEEHRKANSPQAKAAAAQKIKEAEEEKKAAAQLAEDLKTAPKINHNARSKGRAGRSMLEVRTGFSADLSKAKSLAERMDKDVDPHIDNLPDTFIDMAAEELLEIAEMFRQLSFKVRSKKSNKRSHLHAVGE